MLRTVMLFAATAVAEIVGCYLPFLWLRGGRSAWLLVPGAASLATFAWLLTLHPAMAAGRTYAAYAGKPNTLERIGEIAACAGSRYVALFLGERSESKPAPSAVVARGLSELDVGLLRVGFNALLRHAKVAHTAGLPLPEHELQNVRAVRDLLARLDRLPSHRPRRRRRLAIEPRPLLHQCLVAPEDEVLQVLEPAEAEPVAVLLDELGDDRGQSEPGAKRLEHPVDRRGDVHRRLEVVALEAEAPHGRA